MFQSTLPRGERPAFNLRTSVEPQFQSTLPRGERQCMLDGGLLTITVSIHAPAWGATPRQVR